MKKKLLLLFALPLLSLYSFGQVPASERNALIAFYNSTDGSNWTDNSGWNTSDPVTDWYGVTVENIAGQDHVTGLVMNNNNLNGNLPSEIGNLLEIREIDLEFNPLLTGNIPSTIGNLVFIEALVLWENNLTGNIPNELGNLTALEVLSLEDNQLTGNIPTEFSNLTSMTSFWLNGNNLSGDIPDIFSGWTNLFYFSIGNNNGAVGANNSFTGDLDLSNNTNLNLCWIDNTLLSTLNIRNGNNVNISNTYFNALNTPNLTCIFVDDATTSVTNWTNLDPTATFVETQGACDLLNITDETLKLSLSIYPNPTSGLLHIKNNNPANIERVTIINSLGQTILETSMGNTINMSHLSNGLYIVNVKTINGVVSTFKVMKK